MPKFKSLLKRYEIVEAKRRRTCKHNSSHRICKGEKCLVIYEGERGDPYPYCWECACEILKNAHESVECELKDIDD
jgi:hypothetical protein